VFDRHLPVTKEECQIKLKEEFLKNKHITDVRVIDMLVIKVCKNVKILLWISISLGALIINGTSIVLTQCTESEVANTIPSNYGLDNWIMFSARY